jgi:hypothetical protein
VLARLMVWPAKRQRNRQYFSLHNSIPFATRTHLL